jgi:hypothetical protein
MRNDLQAAVAHLEAMAQNAIGAAADADMPEQQKTALWAEYKALDTALTALRDMLKRRRGCDFCNESEQIQNQYGDIMGMDEGVLILDTEGYPGVTFRIKYCPDCGRELSGNAEQVKEGEDETKSVEVEG